MAANYLFRMVERAAGRSELPTPRPPQQFYWPLPWEQPARFSATAPFPSTKAKAPHQAATTLSLIDRQGEAETSTETAIFQPVQELTPPIPPAANERPDFEIVSLPSESTDENTSAKFDQQPTLAALISQPIANPADIFHENIHREKPAPASPQAQHLMAEKQTPDDAFHFNRQNNPHERLRPAAPSAEPVVEVHIARVEVRLDPPRQSEPRAVPKPNGFAEFESMRRYAAGPWSLRKR